MRWTDCYEDIVFMLVFMRSRSESVEPNDNNWADKATGLVIQSDDNAFNFLIRHHKSNLWFMN